MPELLAGAILILILAFLIRGAIGVRAKNAFLRRILSDFERQKRINVKLNRKLAALESRLTSAQFEEQKRIIIDRWPNIDNKKYNGDKIECHIIINDVDKNGKIKASIIGYDLFLNASIIDIDNFSRFDRRKKYIISGTLTEMSDETEYVGKCGIRTTFDCRLLNASAGDILLSQAYIRLRDDYFHP